ARYIKSKGIKTRLNTNGHGNLIHKRNICPELGEVIDTVSISLNAATKERYNEICQPKDKENAFDNLLNFIKESKKSIQNVVISIVTYPENNDLKECEKLADSLGVSLRERKYNFVG
ncbi:MAG: radical SAM protein, partial [Nitrospinae bacterium]|nr:radical SAM protein [Nitrospinota bacterium]